LDQIALGKRLRNKRENILKKSLSQLGDMIGLNKGHLSQIERGKIDVPNVDTLRKIARAYEVNFKELADVFFKTEEKAEEMIKMDVILKQIASDEKYKFRELIEDAMEENMGEKTKLLIIRMYEKMYNGKKLI
jgi:transcriptional regulator with XRE-family HTH domain